MGRYALTQDYLLDTCAVLFTLAPDARFARAAAEIENKGERVLVSPITAWELGKLASKGRIALGREPAAWFATFLGRQAELAPMTPDVLCAASFLPHANLRDPADQIIAATARALGCTIVTRDRLLLDYAEAGWIKALAC